MPRGYSTTQTSYEIVWWPVTKQGPCEVCGKAARRSTTFEQTINPWNKNAAGELKTREEIRAELREKAAAWGKEPLKHARCEK